MVMAFGPLFEIFSTVSSMIRSGAHYGGALAERAGEPIQATEPPEKLTEWLPWALGQWKQVEPYAAQAAEIAGGWSELRTLYHAERLYEMEREVADRTYEALSAFYGYEDPVDPDAAAQLALPMVGAGAADYRGLADFYGYEDPVQPAKVPPAVILAVALGLWWYLQKSR